MCIQTWLIMASPKPRVFFSCHFVNGKNQDLPIQYHLPKFGLTPYHKLDNVMLPPTMNNTKFGVHKKKLDT